MPLQRLRRRPPRQRQVRNSCRRQALVRHSIERVSRCLKLAADAAVAAAMAATLAAAAARLLPPHAPAIGWGMSYE